MRFLDQFTVLLLDMNGTFVFGHDRLGPDQDYFATYARVGGRNLDRASVGRIVNGAIEALWRAYDDPERFDDFPSVAEILERCRDEMDQADLPLIEAVV